MLLIDLVIWQQMNHFYYLKFVKLKLSNFVGLLNVGSELLVVHMHSLNFVNSMFAKYVGFWIEYFT